MLGESENMESLSRLIGRQPSILVDPRRYTTNVLRGYYLDDRLSTLHPFPLDSDGPGTRRYSP